MTEPILDPTTGRPVQPPSNAPPGQPPGQEIVQIDKAEWEGIKQRLDSFEKGYTAGQHAQPPPTTPPPPQGPSFTDQLHEIDTQVAALDAKIDTAVADGKPVSELLRERSTLEGKRVRMQIKHEDIDPAFNAGIQTIDQISAEVTRGKMKYYDLVREDVDTALASIPLEQRMSPQMRVAAYQIAVGKNVDKIMEAQREEILRKDAASQTGEPPAGNARTTDAASGDTTPKPKEVLSANALAAIKSKGITVDQYYQKLGYTDWADFYEKRGKEYFSDED